MKNKKIIHKILSLLLIISMTINIFTITGNASEEMGIDAETIEKLNTHIEMTLPGYLKNSNLLGLKVTISEPMIINKLDEDDSGNESYICFVINNDNIIGKLTLAEYNEEIYSSFDTGNLEEVNQAFNSETPVAFSSYSNCLIMQGGSEATILYGSESEDMLGEVLIQENTELISEVSTAVFRSAMPTRNTNIQLNVPFTYNVRNDNNGGVGLCWAACVASKVRYQYNNATVINGIELLPYNGAEKVYNLLSNKYGGEPIGTPLWSQRGYGYFSISVTLTGCLSAYSVEYALGMGKPIDIGVHATSNSYRHGVVLCGIDYSSTGGYYKIMDPNKRDSYIYSWVNEKAISNGNYFSFISNDGTVYDQWYESMY